MASQRAIIIVNIAPPIKLEINTTLCHVSDEVNPNPEQHIKYGIHYKAIFENNDIDQFVSENDKLLNKDNTLLVYADIGSDRGLYNLLIHVLQTLSAKIIHKKVYVVSTQELEVSDQTLMDNSLAGFRVTNFKDDTFFDRRVSSHISTRQQRIKLDGTYYSRAPFGGDNSLPIRTVFKTNFGVSLDNPLFGSKSSFNTTFAPPPAPFTPPQAFTTKFTPPPAPFTPPPATFAPPSAFTTPFTPPPAFTTQFTPPAFTTTFTPTPAFTAPTPAFTTQFTPPAFTTTFTPTPAFTAPTPAFTTQFTPPAFTTTFTPTPAFTTTFTAPTPAFTAPTPAFTAPTPAFTAPPPAPLAPKGLPIVGLDLYYKIEAYLPSLLTDLSRSEQIIIFNYVMFKCAHELRIGSIKNEEDAVRRAEYYVGIYKLQLILRDNLQEYDIDYEDDRVKNIYKNIMNEKINTKEDVQRAVKGLAGMKKLETVKRGFKEKILSRNKLTCQWWFERFFDTIFDCGKGKIFQSGGTCYLAATLNSILLSNVVKYILIHKMKTAMEDEASKRYITTPLIHTVSTCVRQLYMYRILYNMICSEKYGDGISIENRSGHKIIAMDLMSIESSTFFCGEDKDGCRRLSGGNSRGTSYTMLLESGVSFVVALKSEAGQFRIPNVSIINQIRKTIYLRGGTIFKDLPTVDFVDTQLIDIILYINDTEPHQITKKDKLSRTEEFSDLGFEVDTCTISYHVEAHGSDSHSIAGFSCDDNYKFYDSALNVTIPIDWRKRLDAANYDFGVDFSEFSYIQFETAFYVNTKKIPEYLSKGACPSQ